MSSIAAAQAPPAPPAPPAGGTGDQAPPGATPAATPPGTAPTAAAPPPVGFGETETISTEEPEQKLPPRVPWRGTSVSWTNTATTSLLGVGQDDLISRSHEQYVMNWSFRLNYYVVDQDRWNIQVNTTPGFSTELTNSDATTEQNEVHFNDLPIGAAYGRNLWSHPVGASTNLSLGTAFIFPTSPFSQGVGTLLTTSQRLGLSQSIPLAGPEAPVFKTFNLSASLRWDHIFTEATTSVGDDGFSRGRQDAQGNPIRDDQLTGVTRVHDTLRESVTLSFNEAIPPGIPIGLAGTIYFAHSFKFSPRDSDGCDVVIMGDQCVEAQSATADPNTEFNTIGFNVALSLQPIPEASLAFEYDSGTPQLGPDGTRRDLFFNPFATFGATLTFHPDALYERIIGPRRAIASDKKRDKRRTF